MTFSASEDFGKASIEELTLCLHERNKQLNELNQKADPDEADKAQIDKLKRTVTALVNDISAAARQSTGTKTRGLASGPLAPSPPEQSDPLRSCFEGVRDPATGKRLHVYRHGEQMASPDQPDYSVGELMLGMISDSGSPGVREALNTGTSSAGGVFIAPKVSARFLELISAKSVCLAAGTGIVQMDSPYMRVPKQLTNPTPAWRKEGTNIAIGQPSYAYHDVTPMSIGILVPCTIEMLNDTNSAGLIEQAAMDAMAQAVDSAILAGAGTLDGGTRIEPVGIINTSGVLSHSMAGAHSWKLVSQAVLKILSADYPGQPSDLSWIRNPRDAAVFEELVDTTGQPLQPNRWAKSLSTYETTKMPIDGEDSEEAEVLGSHVIGDFRGCVSFWRQGFRFEWLKTGTTRDGNGVVDDLLSQNKAVLRVTARMDVVVERPSWFALAQDFEHDFTPEEA